MAAAVPSDDLFESLEENYHGFAHAFDSAEVLSRHLHLRSANSTSRFQLTELAKSKLSDHNVAVGDVDSILTAVNGQCHTGIGELEITNRQNPAFQAAQQSGGTKPIGVFNTSGDFTAIEPGEVLGMFAGDYLTLSGKWATSRLGHCLTPTRSP